MSTNKNIKKSFLEEFTRIFSFIICAAINVVLGLSITTEEIIFIVFCAIAGGFIGTIIFIFWREILKDYSSKYPILKAFVFTIFMFVVLTGILFIFVF